MSSDKFDGHILVEKLTKLNSSQQSIESLSHWCITHRKKAKQIVETWETLFISSQREQRVSFLYLANDILQNSRRKGSEYVNEFWKVLPSALNLVHRNGDEHGKKVVSRLVDIWDDRKVFGSRGQSLKDEMLGGDPPPLLVSNGKSSNPIKIVKKDAYSVRIKLAVGGFPEKILTAFQSVHDEYSNEEDALNKCKAAVHHVEKIEDDVENTSNQGIHQGSALVDELQEQESVIQQCVGQLESAEVTRVALVSQLKDALQEQESKLQVIRTQLQVARSMIEQASNMRKRLTSRPPIPNLIQTESTRWDESNLASFQPQSIVVSQPVISFAPIIKTTEEENKKAAAAAVAAKLAASTSSAQMLTSVLSSLVAEEAASSMNGGGFMYPPEKRSKLEKAPSVSNVGSSDTYFTTLQPPMTQFPPPPPPPPPPLSSPNPPANQYVQTSNVMVGVMPYGYSSNTLPPPPPLPPHITMGLTRPSPTSQSPQQPQSQQQAASGGGGYYRPPGIGFYGQSHQSTTPPVPRQ